jgi:hypothetical protein
MSPNLGDLIITTISSMLSIITGVFSNRINIRPLAEVSSMLRTSVDR